MEAAAAVDRPPDWERRWAERWAAAHIPHEEDRRRFLAPDRRPAKKNR